MRRAFVIAIILVVAASSAFAADDAVTRAVKLYEKRHYDEAANLLRAEFSSIDPSKQGAANLALGMIYLKNAVLHRELYRASALATQEYLKKLSAVQGKDRSRFVDLYLGDTLNETGKSGVAAIYLEKFLGNTDVDPKYFEIAKVGLGLSAQLGNDAQKAVDRWAGVNAADPVVKAELAAAYSRAGLADKNPVLMADESLAAAKRLGKPVPMRLAKNVLAVYVEARLTDKGLDLVKGMDPRTYSFRETLGRSKIINFYDLSLLGDMGTLYGQASIAYLEKAAGDPKVKDAAEFHLGQAYAQFGSLDQSAKVIAAFIATSQMPQAYKDRIRVWQGANLYLKNKRSEAEALWDELSRKQPEDPDLLAEIVSACTRLKVESPKVAQKAAAAAETGEGRKFSNLHIAIGAYALNRLDLVRAVASLEAGRDKSNKNKIESNDPVMLVDLADAYFRTKKYSEALEIYFEMSKQFPEVRQIQEAMQGVYAMEHKSAGDVKIN